MVAISKKEWKNISFDVEKKKFKVIIIKFFIFLFLLRIYCDCNQTRFLQSILFIFKLNLQFLFIFWTREMFSSFCYTEKQVGRAYGQFWAFASPFRNGNVIFRSPLRKSIFCASFSFCVVNWEWFRMWKVHEYESFIEFE